MSNCVVGHSIDFPYIDAIFKSALSGIAYYDDDLVFDAMIRPTIHFMHEIHEYDYMCKITYFNKFDTNGKIIGRNIKIKLTNQCRSCKDLKNNDYVKYQEKWNGCNNWKQLTEEQISQLITINKYLDMVSTKLTDDKRCYLFDPVSKTFNITIHDDIDMLQLSFENISPISESDYWPTKRYDKNKVDTPTLADIWKLCE